MTSRERVLRTLDMQPFDQVPIEGWRVRSDVTGAGARFGPGRVSGTFGVKGCRRDAWGCIFEAAEDGVTGEVRNPILTGWSQLDTFTPPWDVLEQADLTQVNACCAASDKFVMERFCDLQPFQRLQYLRGTETLFLDLAYAEAPLYRLRDRIQEYYLRKLEMLCRTDVDGVHVEDDWGSQTALLISPVQWREFFKPLYQQYCDLAHAHGKRLVLHSDGYIAEILPDLVEIGVDAVNAQLDCMDVEAIAAQYHGRITFWGGFDRQRLLPFGTEAEIRAEVRRIAAAFFRYGRTGVVAQCFRDKGVREEAIDAVYDEWTRI